VLCWDTVLLAISLSTLLLAKRHLTSPTDRRVITPKCVSDWFLRGTLDTATPISYKSWQTMKLIRIPRLPALFTGFLLLSFALPAAESPYLYGIFDGGDPTPADASEYLGRIRNGAGPGWVTVTVSVGANTNDTWGVDYRFLSNQGHTVICRINHGYFPNGTIPPTNSYDAFAARCASFVANSHGCSIWTIGNELNISGEWPYEPELGKCAYVSPANYARCFRKVYNAIKAVRPNDKVLPAAPACFAGPFAAGYNSHLGTNYFYDANPLNWVQHLNQLLTAITNTGPNPCPPDGIALHVSSRGYTCEDIHSTARFSGGGAGLYKSFYVYKDWVNLGIPRDLYHLPLYATECNGYFYWKGGHPENLFSHYEPGWMQEVYAEISRYNQTAIATGKPIYRCLNMYQWPDGYDGWNINGSSDYFKEDILNDLDEAVAQRHAWPGSIAEALLPVGINFIHPGSSDDSVPVCGYGYAGVVPQRGWINLTAGGNGANAALEAGMTITWGAPGGTHEFSHMGNSPADFALMQGYLDTSDSSTTTVTVNGVKFPLYDIIVYGDGDNGSATRVGKYTLTATRGSGTKYILDASDTDFAGSFLEADSPTGGAAAAAGNYCRFRDVRGTTFTVTATGEYASDGHPRGPLNAIQIVPINVVPALSDFSYSQFQFWLNGSTGAAYTIESSSDLTRWTPIGTYIAPTQVAVPGGPQHCFYRAVQTQPYDDVPVLSAPSRRGQVQFSLSGATNMNYIIQASTNLVNWTAVSTNRAPARVTLSTGDRRYQFYRALFQ